jgi:hypothetical protein
MLENEILKDQNWVLKPIYMLLLVNYSRNRMTYRFLDLNSNDIYECKDIKFFENFSKSDFPKKKKKKILFVLQVMLIMTNILATCVTRISQDFRSLYHHVNLYQLEERPY